MFNVTVLKMKDIKKYVLGLLVTIVIVIMISKYFPQITKEEKRIPKWMAENSMIGCLEQTVPSMSNMNEEYKKIAKEEDGITEDKFLQGFLKTQISSIKGIEKIEEKQERENIAKEEQEIEKPEEETIEMARNWFSNRSNYE